MSNLNLTTGAGNGPNPCTLSTSGPVNSGSASVLPQPGGFAAQVTANVTLPNGNTVTGVQDANGGNVKVPATLAAANDLPNPFGASAPYGSVVGSAGFGDVSGTNSFRAGMATATALAGTVEQPQQGTPQINAPISISSGVNPAALQTFRWE